MAHNVRHFFYPKKVALLHQVIIFHRRILILR